MDDLPTKTHRQEQHSQPAKVVRRREECVVDKRNTHRRRSPSPSAAASEDEVDQRRGRYRSPTPSASGDSAIDENDSDVDASDISERACAEQQDPNSPDLVDSRDSVKIGVQERKSTGTMSKKHSATTKTPAKRHDKAKKASTTTRESAANSVKGSVRRAAGLLGAQVKRDTQNVLMEDDNIVVYQDVYSVVYKNSDDLYKTVRARVNKALEESEKKLQATFKKAFDAFQADVDRLMDRNMARIRQGISERDPEACVFAVITAKPSRKQTFHITAAVDQKELTKVLNRCKDKDVLVLEFIDQKEFDVDTFRGILKEEGMLSKSNNDFTYKSGDLTDLHSSLVEIINRSSEGCDEHYKLAFIGAKSSCKSGSVAGQKTNSAKRKKSGSKKEDVVRSYAETYTDQSDQEDGEGGEEYDDCQPQKKIRKTDAVATTNIVMKQKSRKRERSETYSMDEDDD